MRTARGVFAIVALLVAGCSETSGRKILDEAGPSPPSPVASAIISDAAVWKGGGFRPDNDPQLIAAGRLIARRTCVACHGEADAPRRRREPTPLRELLAPHEESDQLQVRLMYGMTVGGEPMPIFRLSVADADALMAYLESIQAPTVR